MNSLVLAVIFIAGICLADVSHIVQKPVAILQDDKDVAPDGTFRYQYETENGIYADAQGSPEGAVQGSFRWNAPDGTPVELSYIANENGYQPQGAAIPTSPTVPQSVVRALKYIAAHPYKEPSFNKN